MFNAKFKCPPLLLLLLLCVFSLLRRGRVSPSLSLYLAHMTQSWQELSRKRDIFNV